MSNITAKVTVSPVKHMNQLMYRVQTHILEDGRWQKDETCTFERKQGAVSYARQHAIDVRGALDIRI